MSDIVTFQPVRALDRNGDPVPGALARFYLSGTTSPQVVYADRAETVPHPVPLEADANGVWPAVYLSGVALKVEATDPEGVPLPGFPIDPVATVATSSGAAGSISFNPTGDIPVTNVQAAIERVQANAVAPLLAGGIGVTGNADVLASIDAMNTASGFYRWTGSSTGTFPPGWAGGEGIVYVLRETASNAQQIIMRRDQQPVWRRRLQAGVWQDWFRDDRAPELLEAQATDKTSTEAGLMSGQRLWQSHLAFSRDWSFTANQALNGADTRTITGIPTTATEVEIELAGIGGFASQGTVNVQIGNGSIVATGYNAYSSAVSSSVGTFHSNTHFPFYVVNTWELQHGIMRLRKSPAPTVSWFQEHFFTGSNTGGGFGGGRLFLSTGIDRVRFTNSAGSSAWVGEVRVRAR